MAVQASRTRHPDSAKSSRHDEPEGLNLDARATRSSAVVFRAVGSEYLLVHGLLKQYHVLNSVAGRIWELATGEHTVREMAEIISTEYREDVARVRQDVVETLEGLEALQLVTFSATVDLSS